MSTLQVFKGSRPRDALFAGAGPIGWKFELTSVLPVKITGAKATISAAANIIRAFRVVKNFSSWFGFIICRSLLTMLISK